jgi:hypothetical protein
LSFRLVIQTYAPSSSICAVSQKQTPRFALSPAGDTRRVKHVLPWLAWWLALFWLWFLLVGEWNREELVAAAIAATLASTLAEFARARTGFAVRLSLRDLAVLPNALGMVFVDFGILAWALASSVARRRVVRGELASREGVATSAWTVLVAAYSPNAYPVELDPGERRALVHDLVPHRASERPL